jgi:putative transposase
MPRQARILLANTPHHIVQRGHNRETVFVEKDDYIYYLDTLKEWKQELNVNVYGYCLMTNHVHLILDPRDKPDNLGKLMKRLAGRQTRYVNYQEKRTGSLWEGRYKSSPIETDSYLLACLRYVERNPVKAGVVKHVEGYEWSSYKQHVGLADEIWIDRDPAYLGLADNEAIREHRYKDYLNEAGTEHENQQIKHALQRGQLTGSTRFVDEVERRLGLRVEHRGPGRPRKDVK